MKKVIVTGANGFIGSHVIKELLAQNIKVTAIIRNENGDISLLDSNENLDIVFFVKIYFCPFDSFFYRLFNKPSGFPVECIFYFCAIQT